MFSTISCLVALSVFAATSAKPIKVEEFKCAYTSDSSVIGSDLSRCPQSCHRYSNVALLKSGNWFEAIYLFCAENSKTISPQASISYNSGIVQ